MADQQAISEADVQSLAQKLTQFTQSLTPGEQAALAAVVLRGTPQGEDVEGFFDRRDRGNEGAIGVQVGDPYSPLTNIFTPYSKTFQKGEDRPSERK